MRRRLLLGGIACATLPARAATLPAARSLRDELARAIAAGKPLIVMASLHGCPFCRQARDSYLAPMMRETGQPVVQLDSGSRASVIDFDGAGRTHEELLQRWDVRVFPSVLFFGRGGREAAPRLVGASLPDYYGFYLEERVRTATAALNR